MTIDSRRAKAGREVLRENIATLMQQLGISEAEFARRARVPQTTLNRILRDDDQSNPRINTLDRLARGLRTTTAVLLTPSDGTLAPPPAETPHIIARQIGRLTQDFLLSSEDDRKAILRMANESAEKNGRD